MPCWLLLSAVNDGTPGLPLAGVVLLWILCDALIGIGMLFVCV